MVESKESYKFDQRVEGLKTVDNIIIDMQPLVDAFEQQYKKGLLLINYCFVDLFIIVLKSLLIRFYSSS